MVYFTNIWGALLWSLHLGHYYHHYFSSHHLLANTFMCSIEGKLEERNELPSFYKRYVDDTFTIMPDLNKANVFLDKFNSCHENLNLTMEIAEHDTISFAGMNIAKCGNRLQTTVHRKSTNFTIIVMWTNDTKGVYFPQ